MKQPFLFHTNRMLPRADLKASQLRKGLFFNPDPYVKISILSNMFAQSASLASASAVSSPMSSVVSFVKSHVPPLQSPSSLSSQGGSHHHHHLSREFKTVTASNTCFPSWKSDVSEIREFFGS